MGQNELGDRKSMQAKFKNPGRFTDQQETPKCRMLRSRAGSANQGFGSLGSSKFSPVLCSLVSPVMFMFF